MHLPALAYAACGKSDVDPRFVIEYGVCKLDISFIFGGRVLPQWTNLFKL